MAWNTDDRSSSGLALPVCLAIIVVPSLLALVLSGTSAFVRRYGSAIVRFFDTVGILGAYLSQLAMVIATPFCVYHSFGAYTIDIDPAIPNGLTSLYLAVMSLPFGLGVLVLTVAGLYLLERIVSPVVMKKPRELEIVRFAIIWSTSAFGWLHEKLTALMRMITTVFTKAEMGGKTQKPAQLDDKAILQTELLTEEEEAASDSDASVLDMQDFSGIEQWK